MITKIAAFASEHNGTNVIRSIIDSLLQQTHQSDVVVINDDSRDNMRIS